MDRRRRHVAVAIRRLAGGGRAGIAVSGRCHLVVSGLLLLRRLVVLLLRLLLILLLWWWSLLRRGLRGCLARSLYARRGLISGAS